MQIPDNFVFDLDQAFAGVDERTDGGAMPGSSEVKNGARVASAQNVRFTGRSIETRPGYVYSNRYNPKGDEGSTDADWTGTGTMLTGAGIYTDPNTRKEYVVLAHLTEMTYLDTPLQVRNFYFCRHDSGPRLVAGQSAWVTELYGINSRENMVRCTQLGGDLVVWRRNGLTPMIWDGDWTGEVVEISHLNPNDDTPGFYQPLPPAEFGVVAGDRIVFPYKGGIGYTDILEARRWSGDTANSEGTIPVINVGDDGGAVTGLLWWRGSTLLVFKKSSVWAIENWHGDLSDIRVQTDPITRQAGCVAHDTITEVAGDVMWLGSGGVYSLSKVLDTDKALNQVPVSYLIPKTMDRVNWSKADMSSAVLSREYWHLAVPLDSAIAPNTLLVWSATTGEWQGIDVPGGEYADTEPGEEWGVGHYLALVRCQLFGRDTFSAVRRVDVLTMGWGWKDRGKVSYSDGDIATEVRFRGYHAAEHSMTRWVRVEVETEELGTENVRLQAYGDGRSNLISLQGATTRDRTKWKTYGRVPRDMSNADDDFADPNREDYSLVPGNSQIERATVVGTITGSGNITVTVTGAAIAGVTNPWVISVAVLNGDTAAVVGGKIRAAMEASTSLGENFTDFYEVLGSGNSVRLRPIHTTENDATLNIAIDNDTATGLTPAPTSTDHATAVVYEMPNTSGIMIDLLQSHTLKGNVAGRSRTLSPVVSSTAGRLRLNVLRAAGVH